MIMNKKVDNERADKWLKIRINGELKELFMNTCKENNHKATNIVLDAINNYLKYNKKR